MDEPEFQRQVDTLYGKALAVPGLRSARSTDGLSFYVYDTALTEWKLTISFSQAFQVPALYVKKTQSVLTWEEVDSLAQRISGEVLPEEHSSGELMYRLHTCNSQDLAQLGLAMWLTAFTALLGLHLPVELFVA